MTLALWLTPWFLFFGYMAVRPGEADITHADISKAREILGWEPVYDLESYIADAIK